MAVALPVPTCPNCGARNQNDARACAWCGVGIQAAIAPVIRSEPAPSRSQRFRALEAHPAFPELLAHRPSTEGLTRVGLFEAFGSMIGVGLVVMITLYFLSINPVMALFPAAMGVFLFVRMLRSFDRASSTKRDGMLAVPVVVLERREVAPRDDSSDATRWRALLERDDGTRREFKVPDSVARSIATGDIGVAYVAAGYLAGFRRVDV